MAFDPIGARVFLFGGVGSGGYANDLWQWDGSDWSQLVPATTSPMARHYHGLAFDPTRNQLLLFGGSPGLPPLGDTWTWNDGAWTQAASDQFDRLVACGCAVRRFDAPQHRMVFLAHEGLHACELVLILCERPELASFLVGKEPIEVAGSAGVGQWIHGETSAHTLPGPASLAITPTIHLRVLDFVTPLSGPGLRRNQHPASRSAAPQGHALLHPAARCATTTSSSAPSGVDKRGMGRAKRRTATWRTAVAFASCMHTLPAQHESPTNPGARAAPTPLTKSTAEQKRGTKDAPTHAPLLTLPPLAAWAAVKAGNEALLAARASGKPPPKLADRPAGAGRYVCAVLVCADANIDLPALLGLQQKDVLLLSAPGPFVQPEVVALLEQTTRDERLPLVLVLGHPDCTTLSTRTGRTPQQDALARRLDAVRAEAQRTQTSLTKALVLMQREHLLAASDELREHVAKDELRVIPGEVDVRTGALVWHHHRADELPLQPVK